MCFYRISCIVTPKILRIYARFGQPWEKFHRITLKFPQLVRGLIRTTVINFGTRKAKTKVAQNEISIFYINVIVIFSFQKYEKIQSSISLEIFFEHKSGNNCENFFVK